MCVVCVGVVCVCVVWVWCGCCVGVGVVWVLCGCGCGVGVGVVCVWVLCRCGVGVGVVWVWCVLGGCGCAMHEHSPLIHLSSLCVQVSMLKARTQSGAVFVHYQAITHERSMTLHGKPSHACTAPVHMSRHYLLSLPTSGHWMAS